MKFKTLFLAAALAVATLVGHAQQPAAPPSADALKAVIDYLSSLLPLPAPDPVVVQVPAGASLQAALDAAQPGTEVVLAAGATYTGNFVMERPGVALRGCGATLHSPSNAPALQVRGGGDGLRIVGCGATEQLAFTQETPGDLVRVGTHDQTAAQIPRGHVFEYVHFKGDPVEGSVRGIALHSADTTVTRSTCTDVKAFGRDTQCIAGWNGPGPYTITENYLEGAGENVMFGGSDPSIEGMVPADILFQGNTVVKPLALKGAGWTVKNLFELKAAHRVRVLNNEFVNIWPGQGQDGFAINIKSTNQGGGCTWCGTKDVEFAFNTVRGVSAAVKLAGKPESYPAERASGIHMHHNIFVTDTAAHGGTGRCLQLMGVPDVKFEYNTCTTQGGTTVYVTEEGFNSGLQMRGNIFPDNAYGIKGDGTTEGMASLLRYAAGYVFEGNLVVTGQPGYYASATNRIEATLPADTTGYGAGSR